jgi:hypothetical protein
MNLVKSHPAFNKLFINNDQHALPMIINALIENSENCSFGEFCDAFMKFADDYTNSGLRYGMPDYVSKEAIAKEKSLNKSSKRSLGNLFASKFNNVCIIIPPCSLRRAILNRF